MFKNIKSFTKVRELEEETSVKNEISWNITITIIPRQLGVSFSITHMYVHSYKHTYVCAPIFA